MLAAHNGREHVFTFTNEAPHKLFRGIRADVLVKGSRTDEISGREIVESCGGEVRLMEKLYDVSTSAIVRFWRKSGCEAIKPLRSDFAGDSRRAPLCSISVVKRIQTETVPLDYSLPAGSCHSASGGVG